MLTIMCASTRFPETIPLRSISSKKIVAALIKLFTVVGLPREIQLDRVLTLHQVYFSKLYANLGRLRSHQVHSILNNRALSKCSIQL